YARLSHRRVSTAPYALALHDALPICGHGNGGNGGSGHSSAEHGKSAEAHSRSDSRKTGVAGSEKSEVGLLGALNAAHASATARAHADPNSAVGKIAAYERSREEALTLQDPA